MRFQVMRKTIEQRQAEGARRLRARNHWDISDPDYPEPPECDDISDYDYDTFDEEDYS